MAPLVVTGPLAAEPTVSSAVLTGSLSDFGELNVSQANVSFQWGVSPLTLLNTSPELVTLPGDFSAILTGLDPGTTYYYRARVDWNGTAFGDVRSFTTAPTSLWERPDSVAALTLSALAVLVCLLAAGMKNRALAAICGVLVMLAGVVWAVVLQGLGAIFAGLIGSAILAVGLILFIVSALGRRWR